MSALLLGVVQPAGGHSGSRTTWILIGTGGTLIVLLIVLSLVLRDSKQKQLEHAPGRSLVFPDGKLIDEAPVVSILNQGGSITRLYGTNAQPDAIAAFFDGELPKLEYRRVDPHWPRSEPAGGDAELLRQYENGPFTYRIWLRQPPQRFRGVTVTGPYRYLLYARISNERR